MGTQGAGAQVAGVWRTSAQGGLGAGSRAGTPPWSRTGLPGRAPPLTRPSPRPASPGSGRGFPVPVSAPDPVGARRGGGQGRGGAAGSRREAAPGPAAGEWGEGQGRPGQGRGAWHPGWHSGGPGSREEEGSGLLPPLFAQSWAQGALCSRPGCQCSPGHPRAPLFRQTSLRGTLFAQLTFPAPALPPSVLLVCLLVCLLFGFPPSLFPKSDPLLGAL